MHVNLKQWSDDGGGRASLSETAGSSASHRRVRPNAYASATVLGLTGCSYVLGLAVSERHALPRMMR
jgi:hypothetical protein